MTTITYGPLAKRIKAVIIDSLAITVLSLLATTLLNSVENTPDYLRLVAFLFVFLFYDPIFTSTFGGTIGHMLMGLRVRKGVDESSKIVFPMAFIRFLVKALLGWISLITVSGNKKSKAIHDSIVNSVVIQLN